VKDTESPTVKATPTLPDAQTVTEVQHYTDRLFRFRCTRPQTLRFRSGEFVMIGLMGDPDPKTGQGQAAPAGLFHRLTRPGTKSWSSTRSRCPTDR
jgi:NAD(P)H-flavin reductase